VASDGTIRVLYSFPQKLGANRVCYTAWKQVSGSADAGAVVHARPGVLVRPVPPSVDVRETLAFKRLRVSYKLLGQNRAFGLHDARVAAELDRMGSEVDVVHCWPRGARRTLEVARRRGIPTVLERPNAHTRVAYAVVAREADRLGLELPPGSEHAYDAAVLRIETEEFDLAGHLLCPSQFVAQTFLDEGYAPDRLLRHSYGFDRERFAPPSDRDRNGEGDGLVVLFAGYAAVRKGLHIALEAWMASSAHERGTLLVAGGILPSYREQLAPLLAHPSVHELGHRDDVPELMRQADVFVLPTFEEGFPLVCVEAVASGCVPLVSEVCTDVCVDGVNALVHPVGDVDRLAGHFSLLDADRDRLAALRAEALQVSANYSWERATERLLDCYRSAVAAG
jgi:glycosyltransferase involved in cell wall biosynthesis